MNIYNWLYGEAQITIGEYILPGLKLSKYADYPWRNKKERKEYFDELKNAGTVFTYNKMIKLEEKMNVEVIHILLSWAYVMFGIGIVNALISTTLNLNSNFMPGLIFSGLTILCFGLFLFLRLYARKKHASLILFILLMEHFETWPGNNGSE